MAAAKLLIGMARQAGQIWALGPKGESLLTTPTGAVDLTRKRLFKVEV
jgi:hypothetical protein